MADVKGPFTATVSGAGIGWLIVKDQEYTEHDFGPGALLDLLRAGFVVPVNAPPKPKPKSKVTRASSSNDSARNAGGKRRGSRSARKD